MKKTFVITIPEKNNELPDAQKWGIVVCVGSSVAVWVVRCLSRAVSLAARCHAAVGICHAVLTLPLRLSLSLSVSLSLSG